MPATNGLCQLVPDSAFLDISGIHNAQVIKQSIYFDAYEKQVESYRVAPFAISRPIPGLYYQHIPALLANKDIYLKFYLKNTSNVIKSMYFFPGLYCDNIKLFKLRVVTEQANLVSSLGTLAESVTNNGFAIFHLDPKEKACFIARLNYVRTNVNALTPTLISKDFMPFFRSMLQNNNGAINIVKYLTAGILLMMIFYSLGIYIQSHQIEFLYYSVYAICEGSMFFFKSYLFGSTSNFNYFFEGYLAFTIQLAGYYFYLLFFRKFLNTKQYYPFLEKVFGLGSALILLLLLSFGILYFTSEHFTGLYLIENAAKLLPLMISFTFIIYGIQKKQILLNYLVAGQSILTFFSIISLVLTLTTWHMVNAGKNVLNDALVYYQVGLFFELIFFLSALLYKNKKDLTGRLKEQERLILDNERKEFEKQVAILEAQQHERNRISADMHDELGSGVTAIRLMSEIVKSKMKGETFPEIEKISHSANELLIKMNTIIWTMVSSYDTVESLVTYIRAYAVEFFESTPIQCHFKRDSIVSLSELSGEKRRNLFLAVKEALNNVLKHSQASQVSIHITVSESLTIQIADNGIGIDMAKLRKFGNGLQNMKKRIESIDGQFHIATERGTRMSFQLKLY